MLVSGVRRAGWALREALWPSRCAGCGVRGLWLCEECYGQAPAWSPPWCARCGVPDAFGCRCRDVPPMLDAVRSVGLYRGWIETAVHQLKYGQESARSVHLGLFLARAIEDLGSIDLLAPVPLHRRRLSERGYNQSALLAEAVVHSTGIASLPDVFRRTVDTPHQTRLSAQERRRNLAGAFEVLRVDQVAGRRVLIVDDVYTTGSTAAEFAAVLRRSGATWVGVATIGRAMR